MKTLLDYILEAREYFNPDISLEYIEKIFKEVSEEELINDDTFALISSQIGNIDKYTLEAILCAYFYSKTGMNGHLSKDGCQKFLDMIKKQPVERIKRILGAGGEGMVYDLGDGRVMKMIFDTDFVSNRDINLAMIKKMVGKKFETLPNIYKVTGSFIIRDDVKPNSDKCIKYYKIATTKYPGLEEVGGTMERGFARGKIYDVNIAVPKTKEVQEVRKWLIKLRNELKSIGMEIENNYGDFYPKNLGETKDGRVVYYDW